MTAISQLCAEMLVMRSRPYRCAEDLLDLTMDLVRFIEADELELIAGAELDERRVMCRMIGEIVQAITEYRALHRDA